MSVNSCVRAVQSRGLSSWHSSLFSTASNQAADGEAAAAGGAGSAEAADEGVHGEAAGSGNVEDVTPMTPEETIARLEELEELLDHEQQHVRQDILNPNITPPG